MAARATADGTIDRFLNVPDREIVLRIQSGDHAAFGALFEAYWQPLCDWGTLFVGGMADAEELVADMLAAVWERREVWDVATTVEAYLFTAVRNRALKVLRDTGRRAELLTEAVGQGEVVALGAPAQDPATHTAAGNLADLVRQKIDALPSRYRAVLVLRIRHEFGYEEIASVMGLSPGAARVLVTRALQVLRLQVVSDTAFHRDLMS